MKTSFLFLSQSYHLLGGFVKRDFCIFVMYGLYQNISYPRLAENFNAILARMDFSVRKGKL